MPTAEDLAKLASLVYKGNPTIGAKKSAMNLTLDTSAASSLGFAGTSFIVWSGEEINGNNAYQRNFLPGGTLVLGSTGLNRHLGGKMTFCLGD